MKTFSKNHIAAIIFLLSINNIAFGQVKLGMDIYSHYIWRGADLSAQSLQPYVSFTKGNLTVGAWGAFSTAQTGDSTDLYRENDLFVAYSVPLSAGTFTVSVTDYYIPFFLPPTATFFNYNKKSGSHTVEVGLSYTGTEAFPIALAGYYNAIGGSMDPDNSSFLQASYPITVDSTTGLSFVAGFTPSKSTAWYTTAKAGVCHVGITATKAIKITDSFSLPVNVQYILNPYAEKAYLIFGVSL